MAYDPTDRTKWDREQEGLRARRDQIHGAADMLAYEAGKVRGSRGDYVTPPWMEHLDKIAPTMANPQQFAAAHRYGQTEGYVEHAHDLIHDEFSHRAERIAHEATRARGGVENAKTALTARGIVALAGRSRYPIAPTVRRARNAQARFDEVQGRANDLQSEMDSRLDQVEAMRASLEHSTWKPRR